MVDMVTLAMAKRSNGSFGNVTVNGDLDVKGDIIQQGSSYETHAEKVFSTTDYIIMRDGALVGLASGDYSGFQVKKYDGTNDGRLVIDGGGVARVGDVGDEQPLLTRDEAADLIDGAPLIWDAANLKAISGSGGGGDWSRLTGTNWSSIIEINGMGSPVFLKDVVIIYAASAWSGMVFIPKGYGGDSIGNLSTLRIPFPQYDQMSGDMTSCNLDHWLEINAASITGNSITNGRHALSLSIDFDNKTAKVNITTYTSNTAKSTLWVYVKG